MRRVLITILSSVFFIYSATAQQTTITGQVRSDIGEPVPYAVVTVKNTKRSVSTDANGNYSIKASIGEILTITSVGYKPTETNVSGNITNILMEKSIMDLGNVMVGSRSVRRSSTETAAPVDIIPISRVMNQLGQVDINQILQFVAPSFNSNKQTGADGADHVDPATLRGLGPDQTLVLINGKRRYQSSLVNLYGTRGRGNTGTDLNTIPAASIERIEILRDGASAQYGSDAIAGVINIVMKSTVKQLTANVMAGQYMTGYGSSLNSPDGKILPKTNDGKQVNANVNYGFPVANGGFVNVTGDIYAKEKTRRPNNITAKYPDEYRKGFGDLSATNGSLYFNSAFPGKGKTTLYSFGGFNLRKGDAYAYTRDAGEGRNVTAIYPNGFNPHIKSTITDGSLSLGVRTSLGQWKADFNGTFGTNRFHYNVDSSLNASLEAASPTKFDAGGFQLSQYVASANFTRSFSNIGSGFNLAFGAEFRSELYKIFAGEEKSYKTYGPVIFSIDSNGTGGVDTSYRPGGAQGFPGFRPSDVTNNSRTNVGGYIDAELDITKEFLLTGAIRVENYSDFGFTHNYKLSTRYKITPKIMWRASASTGFRAPSLPQINFSSTFTDVVAGNIIDKVIASNTSNIARQVGIPSLKQERSVNLSTGFTAKPKNLTITVDGYYVKIKDRIVLTGTFYDDDDKIGNILKSLNVSGAQFFTNAVNTHTIGLDVIATYGHKLGNGRINVTIAGNFNKMKIDAVNTTPLLKGKESTYFGTRDSAFLVASAPAHKINLSLDYEVNKWNFLLRFNKFAGVKLINYHEEPELYVDNYAGKMTTDISIGYKISKSVQLTVGGTNILDVYPTRQDQGWTEAAGMWDAVQMGFGGAFYFARVGFKL